MLISIRAIEHLWALGACYVLRPDGHPTPPKLWGTSSLRFNSDPSLWTFLCHEDFLRSVFAPPSNVSAEYWIVTPFGMDIENEWKASSEKGGHSGLEVFNLPNGRDSLARVVGIRIFSTIFNGDNCMRLSPGTVLRVQATESSSSVAGLARNDPQMCDTIASHTRDHDLIGLHRLTGMSIDFVATSDASRNWDCPDFYLTFSQKQRLDEQIDQIRKGLFHVGCPVLELPYERSVVGNWIGFGEIPVRNP